MEAHRLQRYQLKFEASGLGNVTEVNFALKVHVYTA